MGNKETSALISQSDAARMLGVSRQYVNKLVTIGKLRYTIIAGIKFVYHDDIEAMKAGNHE